MAERYAAGLLNELRINEKVSIIGKVDGEWENGIFLADNTARIRVKDISKGLTGIVEIRGEVVGNYEVRCESYNEFEATNFDFSKRAELVRLYQQFSEIGV
ncbi:unnamed protein product [Blepharisma stoltei]|uniref:Replication protein RepA n=1 Tax=Blepharisma stoltei TaxID=1481888 RepID=A0AAU9IXH1_9CILI|nr:unnamed protein product [Blepharisma stoltei]